MKKSVGKTPTKEFLVDLPFGVKSGYFSIK